MVQLVPPLHTRKVGRLRLRSIALDVIALIHMSCITGPRKARRGGVLSHVNVHGRLTPGLESFGARPTQATPTTVTTSEVVTMPFRSMRLQITTSGTRFELDVVRVVGGFYASQRLGFTNSKESM